MGDTSYEATPPACVVWRVTRDRTGKRLTAKADGAAIGRSTSGWQGAPASACGEDRRENTMHETSRPTRMSKLCVGPGLLGLALLVGLPPGETAAQPKP